MFVLAVLIALLGCTVTDGRIFNVVTYADPPFTCINQCDINQLTAIPPFTNESSLSGFSVDYFYSMLFPVIQEAFPDIDGAHVYLAANKSQALLELQSENADIAIGSIFITEELLLDYAFTQPYFTSGLQIAVSSESSGLADVNIWGFLEPFDAAVWFTFLFGTIAAGHVMWLIERSNNPMNFPSSYGSGAKAGVWWGFLTFFHAANIFPVSNAGRLFAIAWSFLGLIFMAAYTANLTTLLSSESAATRISEVSDLPGNTVCYVQGSNAEDYLLYYYCSNGTLIASCGFETVAAPNFGYCMNGIFEGDFDAFVDDSARLLSFYKESTASVQSEIRIRGSLVFPQLYSVAMLPGSQYLDPLNFGVLDNDGSFEMSRLLTKYFGSQLSADFNEETEVAQFGFWDFGGIWLVLIIIAFFVAALALFQQIVLQQNVRDHKISMG